ncbi:MAG: LysR family transcriptional regulator, partial [Caulobacter sp.]|nr:LysR family transcriptional regulator [Caulobacter sp.]
GASVLSRNVVAASLASGALVEAPFPLPPRAFFVLRHKARYRSKAGDAFLDAAKTVL